MDCKLDYIVNKNPFDLDPNEEPHYTVKLMLTMGEMTYIFMIHNPLVAEVGQWETFTTAVKNNTNSRIDFDGESNEINIGTANGKLTFTFVTCRDGSFHTELQGVPNSCAVQTFEQLTDIRKTAERNM